MDQASEIQLFKKIWWKQQWSSIISFFKNITTFDLKPKNKLIIYGLAALGISFLATPFIIRPINLFYRHVVKPRKNFKQRFGTGWAVIAGALDGLGISFAHQLALIGYDLILIGNNHQELQALSQDIQTTYRVKVKSIVFNFVQKVKAADYQKIGAQMEDLDISILINNVGMLKIKPFLKMTAQEILSQIYVNIYSFVFLSRLLIPLMIKRQNRSLVLMVGSGTSRTYTPGYAMYSAAKSCMHNFTKTLNHEYGWKIDFLHHICGEVIQVMGEQGGAREGVGEEGHNDEAIIEQDLEKKQMKALEYLVVLPKDAAKSILDDAGYVTQSHGHIKHLIYNNISTWERVQSTKAKMLFNSIKRSQGENAFSQSAPFSKNIF